MSPASVDGRDIQFSCRDEFLNHRTVYGSGDDGAGTGVTSESACDAERRQRSAHTPEILAQIPDSDLYTLIIRLVVNDRRRNAFFNERKIPFLQGRNDHARMVQSKRSGTQQQCDCNKGRDSTRFHVIIHYNFSRFTPARNAPAGTRARPDRNPCGSTWRRRGADISPCPARCSCR